MSGARGFASEESIGVSETRRGVPHPREADETGRISRTTPDHGGYLGPAGRRTRGCLPRRTGDGRAAEERTLIAHAHGRRLPRYRAFVRCGTRSWVPGSALSRRPGMTV